MTTGSVNGMRVSTILRDTGCTAVIVSDDLLPNVDVEKCAKCKVRDYLGRVDIFPLVNVYVDCDWFTGWVNAVRAPIMYCSVLLGNVPGIIFD